MKLIVKVDPKRSKDPAKHVSTILRGAATKGGRVEEVFPGLRSGSSAGLVSVELDDTRDADTHLAAVKALRDDEAISYVNTPKGRRPFSKEVRMAGPKKAAKKKSSPTKRTAAPKAAPASKAASVQMRSARDPYRGPSAKRIEQSLDKGTSISLNDFRSIIKWS